MKDICKIFCLGRISQKPSLKKSEKGDFLTFSIAVHDSVKNGDVWESVPTFFNVSTWQAKLLDFLEVGKKVAISGDLNCNKYKNKNGEDRMSWTIRATDIEFTDFKEKTEGEEEKREKPKGGQKATKANDPDGFNEEELPF